MSCLGVQTSDFSVYYDLVHALRERRIPFVPLAPGEPVPLHVGAVLTTAAEADLIAHPHVVSFSTVDDTLDVALHLLHGRSSYRLCVIGVDPGDRPGIAVLADGKILRLVHAPSPEAVRVAIEGALATFPAGEFVLRIGNGAPTSRDRILRALDGLPLRMELVDETRSTPIAYHGNAERDTVAATNIALTPGRIIDPEWIRRPRPTDGELRDIQRKSRLASEGMVTISRALARHVALGRLTMDQAIERYKQQA